MISRESREWVNEYIKRKNGVLRTMVAVVGFVALVTAYIAWDLSRDAKKKDTAREDAVGTLLKAFSEVNRVWEQRFDSLANFVKKHHPEAASSFPKLDTSKLRQEIYNQQEQKK